MEGRFSSFGRFGIQSNCRNILWTNVRNSLVKIRRIYSMSDMFGWYRIQALGVLILALTAIINRNISKLGERSMNFLHTSYISNIILQHLQLLERSQINKMSTKTLNKCANSMLKSLHNHCIALARSRATLKQRKVNTRVAFETMYLKVSACVLRTE